jgi:hypothetical protein
MIRKPYPIRLLNEKTRFNFFWNQFKNMLKEELNDDMIWFEDKYGYGKYTPKTWEDFNDREKIIDTLLWIL